MFSRHNQRQAPELTKPSQRAPKAKIWLMREGGCSVWFLLYRDPMSSAFTTYWFLFYLLVVLVISSVLHINFSCRLYSLSQAES